MSTGRTILAAVLFIWCSPALSQTTLPTSSADWIVQGDPNGSFGSFVASAGDLDGDGYDDVLVGDPFYDGTFANSGRIFLYRGSTGGPSTTPTWILEGSVPGAPLNQAYPAGDVNGDSFDDLIVRYELSSQPSRADLTLYLGSAAGPVPSSWTVSGWSTRAGDINGDGFDDLAVLADRDVLVFYGSAGGLPPAPGTTLSVSSTFPNPLIDGAFEDLNGDGYDDFALTWDYCAKDKVCFFLNADLNVYLGSANGLSTQPKRKFTFKARDESPEPYLTSAGDVDADGFGDLAIPVTPGFGSERESSAELYWIPGSASGLSPPPILMESSSRETYVDKVNGAGDINGDGFADLLVPNDEELGFALRIYTGGPGGYVPAPTLIIEGGQGDFRAGARNAGAGDVNGDGLDDFIVSLPRFHDGQQTVGRVYGFLGRTTF